MRRPLVGREEVRGAPGRSLLLLGTVRSATVARVRAVEAGALVTRTVTAAGRAPPGRREAERVEGAEVRPDLLEESGQEARMAGRRSPGPLVTKSRPAISFIQIASRPAPIRRRLVNPGFKAGESAAEDIATRS